MRVLVIEAPQPVIDLSEALEHLKVDAGLEDALITGMVAAATGVAEDWTQTAIGEQVLEARFSAFDTCRAIRLPRPPVAEMLAVSWTGSDRQQHEGDLADLELADRDVIPIGTAPWSGHTIEGESLRIRYRAGFDPVPDQIRSAILLMTSFLYHNRGAQTAEPPAAVAILLQPFRVYA